MKEKLKIYTLIVTSILVLLTGVMIYHMFTMKSATNQLIVSQQKSVKTFDKSILPLLEEIELNLQILFLILLIIVFIIIFGLYFIKSRRVLYAYDSLTDNIKEKTHEMESQKEELRLKKVLEQQNKQFLKAQKVANIGFWELDLVENKLVWSDAIYRIFELDPKKFDSSFENFLQMIHPEDRDKVNLAYSNSLETKEPYSIKHRLLMDDGRIKWVIEECDTEFDEAGNPLISLGVVQDITADIQYQQQLFEKSEQFSIITKMASAAIYMTDVSGKCTYVNDLWLKFAGMKKEEAFGEGWKQAIFEEDQEQVFSSWDKMIASQGTWGLEYRFVTKENVVTWIYGTANAIKDKDGKVTGYIGVNMDITELKEKEKQLFQQASLAQIGELLGNIAHQWRQPLSAITGTTTLLELKMLMTDTFDKKLLTESIEKINEHTQYLSGTINDFRNFFLTNNSGNIEKVDLKESLEKVERLVIDVIKHNYISVVDDFSSCEMDINESMLIQALLNIYTNAIDVMKSETNKNDKKYLFVTLKEDEKNIVISLKDSGGGVSDDIISRVFEPYFTTKHKSNGTGIGLYMTHQIITKHLKGTIDLKNCSYAHDGHDLQGAEFTITLPRK